MPWPLEPEGVRQFAEGLEEILVVEEKRQVVEYQLKEQLYNWRDDVRPRVVGKFDEKGEWVRPHGDWLLPAAAELTPAMIARVDRAAHRALQLHPRAHRAARARVDWISRRKPRSTGRGSRSTRMPYFCSGCPHNTSTRVPEGSRARGRHRLPRHGDLDGPRAPSTFTQMGGEGVHLDRPGAVHRRRSTSSRTSATAPTSTRGILAIRAAVAAGVNITYKILYNDAVAMTGGQPVDGPLSPCRHRAPGRGRRRASASSSSPTSRTSTRPRRLRRAASRSATATSSTRCSASCARSRACTVLIYDQTCAAEKRRRRKRGKLPDPAERVFINDAVCEGCGDCGVQSNCVSVVPVETEFGRKRAIDQSLVQQGLLLPQGLLPELRHRRRRPRCASRRRPAATRVPDAARARRCRRSREPYGILVTGIGGTGVVTIGALLGMAAHLEGKGVHRCST